MLEERILLAEWLGYKWNDHKTRIHSPACQRDECYCNGKPPDFLHSEEASAMLLEKMTNPVLVRLFSGDWMCDADQNSPLDTEYRATDRDRKAAIYAAALKLAKEG